MEVKWGTEDDQYTLLKSSNNTEYGVWLEYLWDNLAKDNWIYDIKDSAIFIYPTPTQSVTDGIKIQAIISLIDLAWTEDETDIFPWHSELRDWHYMIAKGMERLIYKEKQEIDKSQIAKQEFEVELNKMIKSLKRYQWNTVWKLPNLDYLKY